MAYVVLALIGLGLALWTGAGARRVLVSATFVVAAAIVLAADWVAFGWFHLYDYHPYLAADHMVDQSLGEVLGEVAFVPGLAVFLHRWLPGVRGSVVGALVATGIELIFLRAGLFSHHGWSAWYTAIGFPVYLTATQAAWSAFSNRGLTSASLRRLLRLSAMFTAVSLLTLFLRAMRFVETNIAVLPTYVGNQSLGRFITYGLVTVPLGYWVAGAAGAQRWGRLAAGVVALMGLNMGLTAIGFQIFIPPWHPGMDAIAQGSAIGLGLLILAAIQALDARTSHQRTRT